MKRIAWIIALGAALTASPLFADEDAAPDNANANVSVLVQTTAVKKGSLPQVVVAYGTVQANRAAHESLMAPVAAIVADVYVIVGQSVAKGEPLFQLTPTPTTRAAYSAAASAQHVASDTLTRTRQLLAESLATEPQLAAAEKADSDAREALAALKAQGAAGPTIVRAPAAAVVTAVTATTSAIVTEGAPLLELAQPARLVLFAGVVPALAAEIKPGDKASVTPVSGTGSYAAKVALRGGAVDPGNGLVPIEISLPPGALMPGESAQAAITTGLVQGWVVPHEAVLVNNDGETYVVQAAGGVAKTVQVKVLLSAGENDVIDGKIDASAPLILAGAFQLQDGMKVRLSNAAAQAGK